MMSRFVGLANPPRGTEVTCEQGHRICEVIGRIAGRPRKSGTQKAFSAGFGNYSPGQRIAVAGDGAIALRCSICGARWVDQRPTLDGTMAAKVHLADGWWP